MDDVLGEASALSRAGRHDEAAERLDLVAAQVESPDDDLCARLATAWYRAGDLGRAAAWAVRTVDGGSRFTRWRTASRVLDDALPGGAPGEVRRARVAVLGTSTTTTLLPCLRLALARIGIAADLYESPYGQYWQESLASGSGLRRFGPDVVVFVPDHHAIGHETEVGPLDAWLEAELARWTSPWRALRSWSSADIVQLGFVEPAGDPMGDAAASMTGSRRARVRALNHALATAASAEHASFVDTEALAADVGKRTWFDNRFWHAAKHAFSMAVAPELGLRVSGVIAGRFGLSKKVVVVDLDNTLWHGVIGDDGLQGIELAGARGEAHVEFQRALAALGRRGVLLAVCSKNDEAVARLPFEQHPDMALAVDDFVSFVANWDPKPLNLERMASSLSLGLDSFLYIDDNPAEREAIRRSLPMVDVLRLSADESDWPDDLARYPWLAPAGLNDEDGRRRASYRGLDAARELEALGESLEDFQRSLQMTATLSFVDDLSFDRVVQLLSKTNQFNLTTRRHGAEALRRMRDDPDWVVLTARLADRFADHGLVAVALAHSNAGRLDVDNLVMSCRVIGRGLETVLVNELIKIARERGLSAVRGQYVPTDRNSLVADLWRTHGFEERNETADAPASFELAVHGPDAAATPPISIVRT